jgi:hypothetical protein
LLLTPELCWRICYRDVPVDAVDIVWVLSDPDDLRWAIANRSRMRARELWAGPNLVVGPLEQGGLLTAPEIDRCIVPSQWVADFYAKEAPSLASRLKIWPAGIDTRRWAASGKARAHFLVYNKYQDAMAQEIQSQLALRGLPSKTIIYGDYTQSEYKSLLDSAIALVWLSRSESQGLALMEAMSMNVPVLAWNCGTWSNFSHELGREFAGPASSAPWFDERCGVRFSGMADFPEALADLRVRLDRFAPREFLIAEKLDIRDNLGRLFELSRNGDRFSGRPSPKGA